MKAINPDCTVEVSDRFVSLENLGEVLDGKSDLTVDAIDSLKSKCDLLFTAYANHCPIVSSMGAALRRDPSLVTTADLMGLWYRGEETVLLDAGKIHKAFVALLSGIIQTCPASYDIAVHVNGICGILHRDDIVRAKQFLEVRRIALGSVADEKLHRVKFHTPMLAVVGLQCDTCRRIALLIPVTGIGCAIREKVDLPFHDGP